MRRPPAQAGARCAPFSNMPPACPKMERAKGFEPSTPTLARLCSTPELRPLGAESGRSPERVERALSIRPIEGQAPPLRTLDKGKPSAHRAGSTRGGDEAAWRP